MTLLDAEHNIGNWVQRAQGFIELGVITSVSAEYVWVRYEGDQHSKATKPEQLEFYQRPRL